MSRRRAGGAGLLRAVSAALMAIVAVPSAAQEPGSRPTREFVQAAAQSDQFEILEAQTVLGQSTNADVRAFAQQMIQAHRESSRALEQAAARAGLPPPVKGLGGDQAQLLNALQSLRGAAFDQAYATHQAFAHRSALVVEQAYAAGGDTPVLRQMAASTVPIIAGHLAMADQLASLAGNR